VPTLDEKQAAAPRLVAGHCGVEPSFGTASRSAAGSNDSPASARRREPQAVGQLPRREHLKLA
jgi:hypothetical protein